MFALCDHLSCTCCYSNCFSQATPSSPDAEIFCDDLYGALQVTLIDSAAVNTAVVADMLTCCCFDAKGGELTTFAFAATMTLDAPRTGEFCIFRKPDMTV